MCMLQQLPNLNLECVLARPSSRFLLHSSALRMVCRTPTSNNYRWDSATSPLKIQDATCSSGNDEGWFHVVTCWLTYFGGVSLHPSCTAGAICCFSHFWTLGLPSVGHDLFDLHQSTCSLPPGSCISMPPSQSMPDELPAHSLLRRRQVKVACHERSGYAGHPGGTSLPRAPHLLAALVDV